jgi:hypothetical protein
MHSCREHYTFMRGHDQWVGPLAVILIAATDLPLVGVLTFLDASVAVMAAILTAFLGGGHDYPGSPDRSDGWGS